MTDQAFRISLFDSKLDAAPKPAERTWAQICARIEQPLVRAEKDGALFSPASFDPARRKKENVTEVSLLVLDYDHDASLDRDTTVWRERGLTFAAYTTHSSRRQTDSNPDAEERFRVIVPLSEPIPAAEFPKLWQWAAKASGGKVDASAKDASRMFYTPAIAEAGAQYRFDVHDGALLNWRAINLEAEGLAAIPQPPTAQRQDIYGQAALRDEANRVLTAANGHRNETLNRAAFSLAQLAASGVLTEAEIEATLERAAVGAGLAASEARCTIKSGLQAGSKEPRTLPDSPRQKLNSANSANSANVAAQKEELSEEWEAPAAFNEYDLPDFPIEMLAAWLKAFVSGLARETQTPVDMAALLSLAACSAAVAGNVRIEARAGWAEPLNLYTVVAAAPGNRKSAVFASVAQPLESFEAALIAEQREVVARAESEYRTLAARLDHLEKAAAKIEDEGARRAKQREAAEAAQELARLDVPKLPRLLADDATPETLATLLHEQAGRIALFSPEGDLFDLMGGRYSAGTPNLGVFLKGHAGDDLRVDRRGRSEYVKRPALTIGLAVQPDVIRGLVSKPAFRGRGLLGRFLYSLPKSTLGNRKTRVAPLDEAARAEYARRVKAMAGLMVDFDEDGHRTARILRLTPEADDCLADFEQEIEPQLSELGELGALTDWAGKLAGAVLRIAGVLHLADHAGRFQDWPERVSAETLRRAVEIGRYLIPHAQAAYAEMGADPEIEAAKIVLRWIEKAGAEEFTKRQAFEATKSRFKKVENLDPALRLLEEHNYVRMLVSTTEPRKGRKASQLFEVNPFLLSASHKSHKSHKSALMVNSAICAICATEPEKEILG
ncbi:MAG: YfjI family protein, partial [Acidobacteriota bacterium]|nr:YfjI family protein [Acidobacteriota bacterium]